jgi:hypothetical protein
MRRRPRATRAEAREHTPRPLAEALEALRSGAWGVRLLPAEGSERFKTVCGKTIESDGTVPVKLFANALIADDIRLRPEGDHWRVDRFQPRHGSPGHHLMIAIHESLERDPSLVAPRSVTTDQEEEHPGHEDETVEIYLSICEALRLGNRHTYTEGSAKGDEELRHAWASLRDARIFSFAPATHQTLHHELDVWSTEQIAGVKWAKAGEALEGDLDGFSPKEYVEKIEGAAKLVPFPEALPFDRVFIGFGSGSPLSTLQFAQRLGLDTDRVRQDFEGGAARLLGFIVDRVAGTISSFVAVDRVAGTISSFVAATPRGGSSAIATTLIYYDHHWVLGFSLDCWLVSALFDLIASFRTFVIEKPMGFDLRRRFNPRGKVSFDRPIPRPYYAIRLRQKIIRDAWKNTRPSRYTFHYKHRFDVRAHERVYIHRGPLPMAEKERKLLTADARRRIYEHRQPSDEDAALLHVRGIAPKSAGEWLAVLSVPVKSQIRPANPELPYVPAVRKTG